MSDAGEEGGPDASSDAGKKGGPDASSDAGEEGGLDASSDAGPEGGAGGDGGTGCEAGQDQDRDGFCSDVDCDDESQTVHPGADESCNDIDDDCDGETDEEFGTKGDPCDGDDEDLCVNGTLTCKGSGDGVVCVNESPAGIEEICNGEDDDCDGETDENPVDGTAYYPETDGDGYGDENLKERFCSDPGAPRIKTGGDCDDTLAYVHPGVPELPDDGVDQNCDGAELSIDDDTAIFVKTDGDDDPGTRALPKQTINAAVTAAEAAGKVVAVAAGTYGETILLPGVSIFGGY